MTRTQAAARPRGRRPAGFTVAELLLASALLAALGAAMAAATQAFCQTHSENLKLADLAQRGRIILNRLAAETRTASAVNIATNRLTILPAPNAEGLTQIKYELDQGTLYYRRTVNGTETSYPLVESAGDVRVGTFAVSRVTATDGGGVLYTRSVTVRLTLTDTAGRNSIPATVTASLRRNQ